MGIHGLSSAGARDLSSRWPPGLPKEEEVVGPVAVEFGVKAGYKLIPGCFLVSVSPLGHTSYKPLPFSHHFFP